MKKLHKQLQLYQIQNFDFYEEVLKILEEQEINEYHSFNDIFLKSHYYFQMMIDNHYPGVKLLNTNSAFFEYNNKIHFTHHKLTRCLFYVIKHPYQIFSELKQEGLTAQAALSLLCNLENKPTMRYALLVIKNYYFQKILVLGQLMCRVGQTKMSKYL